jgi:hypothetical protein
MQFLCQEIQGLCRQESKDWGEGADQTQEIAVFQSREGTERSGESVETNRSERNTDDETRFTGY